MNRIHANFKLGCISFEPDSLNQKVDCLVKAHVTGMEADVQNHTRSAPQPVAQLRQTYVITCQETLFKHHLFGKQTPAFRKNGLTHHLA